MDILSRAGGAFKPEDRLRLDALRKKREAREAEPLIDIPDPSPELIREIVPTFAADVRMWLARSATDGSAPAKGDEDLHVLGVEVAKRETLSRGHYWMLADMTADAIRGVTRRRPPRAGSSLGEASHPTEKGMLAVEGTGSCLSGGSNLPDATASATALRRE